MADSCYLERSAVRAIFIHGDDDQRDFLEGALLDIDALPITAATDLQNAEIERLTKERDAAIQSAGHHFAKDCMAQVEIERLRALLDQALYSIGTDSYEDQAAVAANIKSALASQQSTPESK